MRLPPIKQHVSISICILMLSYYAENIAKLPVHLRKMLRPFRKEVTLCNTDLERKLYFSMSPPLSLERVSHFELSAFELPRSWLQPNRFLSG